MGRKGGEIRRAGSAGDRRSTSTSLIQQLRVHDAEAWRRLLGLYVPLVFSWCRRAGLQAEDSTDVVQDVFQDVFGSIATFRYAQPEDTFRGWLRTITRNRIRDHFRMRARQPVAMGGSTAQQRLMDLVADDREPQLEPGQLSTLLRRALDLIREEFEQRTWQAFWLTAVQQQPSAGVGRQLGMSSGAVRQAKYVVLRRLRQELGDAE